MLMHYEIATAKISINNILDTDLSRLKLFKSSQFFNGCANITIKKAEQIHNHSSAVSIHNNLSVANFPDGKQGYVFYSDKKVPITYLISDSCWKNIDIDYCGNSGSDKHAIIDRALGKAFSNIIIMNGGLIVHSSAIEYQKKGLIFSAPSGTGKSTHTAYWRENLNAEMINDDAPVLIPENGKVLVCGTPWSGSSNLFRNVFVPLEAIIVLARHHKNEINEISMKDSVQKLFPRCFFPYHNQSLMNTALEIFKRIIESVPLYHLKCTPSLEAVKLVKSYLRL